MTDYSELHDQQINMMVCKELGLEMSGHARIMALDDATILLADNKTLVDYCNNPADAWPIIEKEEISIIFNHFSYGIHAAIGGKSGNVIYDDANPLRAAMVVFLVIEGFR